mmetsp:Transcript_23513/g.51578  ORF Transcript_23513/g.51578 Transcript_23513/m.51578 type:complete len:97 (-) Transcript_23513:38-328(-)
MSVAACATGTSLLPCFTSGLRGGLACVGDCINQSVFPLCVHQIVASAPSAICPAPEILLLHWQWCYLLPLPGGPLHNFFNYSAAPTRSLFERAAAV